MPRARPRLVAALAGALAASLLLGAAGTSGHVPSGAEASSPVPSPAAARAVDAQGAVPHRGRLARAALTWRGGPVTASTGEVVRVFVSDALPEQTPEQWAEFLARLTHGPELAALTAYIGALDDVQQLCGSRALGCYQANQMVALGEPTLDGVTPEEVVRHEYGHHVAFHRLNTPWRAIDWGPKQWASAADVCARVARREAFPGDEGSNYAQNPGEAWAEVYRLMDERKAGILDTTWQIVAPSFYPDEAALQAAERDVLKPWTRGRTLTYAQTFAKGARKAWWIRLQTPLDGDLRLTAVLPRGGLHDVALVSGNRSTVLRRAQWVGQRAKRLSTSVCGQRELFVRVTPNGVAGKVRVTVTAP